MNLSPNFTLEELTVSDSTARFGWDNTPTPEALENLKKLAVLLEQIRALLGKPIIINSGYRSPKVNDHVGGKPNSQHVKGQAADIRVPGMTPDQVIKAVVAAKLPYDQIILEFNSWVHVSISSAPRTMALIIDNDGTRQYS